MPPLRVGPNGKNRYHEVSVPGRDLGFGLVSFDIRTIPPLLRSWGEQGIDHGGLIFIDEKSIAQNDLGRLALALCDMWKVSGEVDWMNRFVFLYRPEK